MVEDIVLSKYCKQCLIKLNQISGASEIKLLALQVEDNAWGCYPSSKSSSDDRKLNEEKCELNEDILLSNVNDDKDI